MTDQADTLRKLVSQETRIIAVASGKGGVGKTSLSVNLSVQLAKMGKKVLLLDADLGMANVDILLGVRPEFTLVDVLQHGKSIQEVITSTRYGVKVIAGVSGMASLADLPEQKRVLFISELKKLSEADYLVIDTGAGISKNVIDFVLAAEDAFIVLTPEPTSIQDSYGLIKVLSQSDRALLPEIQILVNLADSLEQGTQLYQKIQKASSHFLSLHVKHFGPIVKDEKVHAGVLERRPFVIGHPESNASKQIVKMAESLSKQMVINSRGTGISGLLKRLLARH